MVLQFRHSSFDLHKYGHLAICQVDTFPLSGFRLFSVGWDFSLNESVFSIRGLIEA